MLRAFMTDWLSTFIFFFAVIDPVGTVPVFISVTTGMTKKMRQLVAMRAALVASVILVFFVFVGEPILTAMNIPLSAFQIAGGVVLFLVALTMIFGEGKPESEKRLKDQSLDVAVFPLAVPSLAGPGAILASVMQTEKTQGGIIQQFEIIMIILAVIGVAYFFMVFASTVQRLIGESGANAVSRVTGLLLASVAVNSVLSGLKIYFVS